MFTACGYICAQIRSRLQFSPSAECRPTQSVDVSFHDLGTDKKENINSMQNKGEGFSQNELSTLPPYSFRKNFFNFFLLKMGSNNAQWADTPFTLIPTPGRGENLNKREDAVFIAREMANAHNGMLRALNSIYQQCIFVKDPKDVKDLLLYATFWCDWIHEHHDGEETFFFPRVEEITSMKGLMEIK